jgi:hypothetical protein
MFVVMLLCALPAILFAPMTALGALGLNPLAVIFLCFGIVGIGLMIFYFRYSTDLSHDSDHRKKVWVWWGASICAFPSVPYPSWQGIYC